MSIFNKNSEKVEQSNLSNSSNIIGKGTTITGDIETFGNIRFDGKLIGNISSKSKVILGEGSEVEGNITAANAEVQGNVTGKIDITEVLILKPTAVINGDITTDKLVVETGAVFNGSCVMGTAQPTSNAKPRGKERVKETA